MKAKLKKGNMNGNVRIIEDELTHEFIIEINKVEIQDLISDPKINLNQTNVETNLKKSEFKETYSLSGLKSKIIEN